MMPSKKAMIIGDILAVLTGIGIFAAYAERKNGSITQIMNHIQDNEPLMYGIVGGIVGAIAGGYAVAQLMHSRRASPPPEEVHDLQQVFDRHRK